MLATYHATQHPNNKETNHLGLFQATALAAKAMPISMKRKQLTSYIVYMTIHPVQPLCHASVNVVDGFQPTARLCATCTAMALFQVSYERELIKYRTGMLTLEY